MICFLSCVYLGRRSDVLYLSLLRVPCLIIMMKSPKVVFSCNLLSFTGVRERGIDSIVFPSPIVL